MTQVQAIPIPELPDATQREVDFLDSSFFKDPDHHLPTPTEVRALSKDYHTSPEPVPVIFQDLAVFVKFGRHINVAEAQNLWIIKRVLHDKVPVPEVFGWRVDGDEVFIYMELIHGKTLKSQWNDLDGLDKEMICDQLCSIIGSLRQLEPDPAHQFIGSINQQSPLDYVFERKPKEGPFWTTKDFHDWFSVLPQLWLPISKRSQDPYRHFLPDDGPIKFTHADLHRGNIIISETKPPRVLAIVDWAQSGWYPDYWEYCKALYTCFYEDEWRQDFIDKFLSPRMDENDVFMEYIMAMGAV